ncbi:MAG: hypothetical protein G5663_02805 [Serratia symbiotica]|nr:hypothetical protein [Serratia symbiotica]
MKLHFTLITAEAKPFLRGRQQHLFRYGMAMTSLLMLKRILGLTLRAV